MASGGSTGLSDSRPSIHIDGERDARLTSGLLSMDIIDSAEGMPRATLWFGNWGSADAAGFQHFDRERIEFGREMRVHLGNELLFAGRVSAIRARYPEGATPEIAVCLEDRLQDLRMTRRSRCFDDATLQEVIERIAEEHGLSADVDLDGPRLPVRAQLNQSDLAFLRDQARCEDVQLWTEDSALWARTRDARDSDHLELKWAGSLRAFDVSADLAHQRTGLVASGWDVAAKEVATHEADDGVVRGELGDGQSGAEVLGDAFGERVDTLAHGVPPDADAARAFAEASMRHLARRFLVGRGIAETSPRLRIGAKVTIGGLGPLFDGDYTLHLVHHRFDARGLRTEIGCDRPAVGRGQ
jgi:phage protein D